MKKRNILKICFLAILFAMLVPAFASADMTLRSPKIFWEGKNPFHQPFSTTYYYGSGDVNLDAMLNTADIIAIQEIINGSRASNIMADVNGDGNINGNDSSLLTNAVYNGGILPGWWNSLTTRQARVDWVNKMLAIDKTNMRFYKNNWECGNYAAQTAINFAYSRWNLDYNFYTGGQTVFNMPMYDVSVYKTNFGHGINAILVGDNPLSFDDWMFIEPQSDSQVTPGSSISIPEGSTVSIYAVMNESEGGDYGNPAMSIRFNAMRSGSTLQSYTQDLVLTRPPVSTGTILNPVDRWSPKILKKGSGYMLFDQLRSDMSRTSDIHITSLPYPAAANPTSVTNREYANRLIDTCVSPDGTTHIIWTGVNEEAGSSLYTGIYYGKLNPVTGTLSETARIADTYYAVTKGRILYSPNGTIHVLVNNYRDASVDWYTKSGNSWSSVTRVVENTRYENNSFTWAQDIRDPKKYFFDAVLTSNSEIVLSWIGIDTVNDTNTIYCRKYSPSTNTWGSPAAIYSGTGTSKPCGLSMAWDGSSTQLAFWNGIFNASPTFADFYRGNINVMSLNGTTWTTPLCLDDSGQATSAKITSDGRGKTCLVWDKRINTMSKPVYSVKIGAGSWRTPEQLSVRTGAEAFYPDAAFTEDGSLYICWSSRTEETIEIETYRTFVCGSSNPLDPQTRPPVLYYDFDNGQAPDMSGNNNNGTLGGSTPPSSTTGTKKQGMYFGGTSYITAQNSSSLNFGTGDFSISCWVKTTASYAKLLNKKSSSGVGFSLELYGGVPLIQVNDPANGFYNYYNLSIPKVNNNAWHLITVTFDRDSNTGVKIYTDGVLRTSQNALYRQGSLTNTGILNVGKDTGGSSYIGTMDELRIYDRVILGSEIQTLYSDFYNKVKLSFDGNLSDISGNGNSVNSSFAVLETGPKNTALCCNSSDSTSIAYNPTQNLGTNDFSIGFWMKRNGLPTYFETILEKMEYPAYKGYSVDLFSQGIQLTVGHCTYSHTVSPSNTLFNNQWHYVVFMVDRDLGANGIKMYIDGVLASQYTSNIFGSETASNSLPLNIGRDHFWGYQYNGSLDELSIYEKVLTPTEITAKFSEGQP